MPSCASRCAACSGNCWPARPPNSTPRPTAWHSSSASLPPRKPGRSRRSNRWKSNRTAWARAPTSWTPSCGKTRTCLGRRRWNSTAPRIASASTASAAELETRGRQLVGELEQAASQAAQLAAHAAAHQQAVAALRGETLRLEALLVQLGEQAQQLAGSAQSTDARIEELRLASGQLGEELTRLHGEHAQAEQSLAHLEEAHRRQELAEQQLLEEALDHRERAQAAELFWQSSVERARALEHALREVQGRIAELRSSHQETTARCDAARDALAGARARRASLEQILNDRSYTADAVQKLFASNGEAAGRGFRAVGVLADYAEVEEQYESAVEQFLRDELEYVVVETFDHARAGIALLREEVGGRATFFVDSMRHLRLAADQPVVTFRPSEGVVSRLDRLVEFRDPLGPAAKQFLPRLRSAFLVETSLAAEKLARENSQCHFVTPDGTCYQGRMVSGGRPAEAGPLVMKRELRKLDAEVLQLERAAAEAQEGLGQILEELRTCETSLERATAQRVEAEKGVVAATLQRDQARGDLIRLSLELSACQNELARLRDEVKSAQSRAGSAQQRRTDVLSSRAAAETEIE